MPRWPCRAIGGAFSSTSTATTATWKSSSNGKLPTRPRRASTPRRTRPSSSGRSPRARSPATTTCGWASRSTAISTKPSDIDVYSFQGTAGTEVWFDIDRTTHSLDTVVELIDASGQIIAQSDNSLDETAGTIALYEDVATRDVNILQNQSWRRKDDYTTNPRDAGFRVVLPGTVGEAGTFHVRIRSSNLQRPATPAEICRMTRC